jgi:hypothetical protein
MKTQNITVLTVEFTRIPLFPAVEAALFKTPSPPTSPLIDALATLKVTESS